MEKLRIYQKALQLIAQIYRLIQTYPHLTKDYALSDQLRRASVSILANIAEGYLRPPRHFAHYLTISSGSGNEVIALLQITSLVHAIDTSELQAEFRALGKQTNAFARTLSSTQNNP